MDGGTVESRMSDAAKLKPSDEGESCPEKRSCDEELRMGPNDGHNEVGNGKNCRLKCRDEDRKVTFQDRKKDGITRKVSTNQRNVPRSGSKAMTRPSLKNKGRIEKA